MEELYVESILVFYYCVTIDHKLGHLQIILQFPEVRSWVLCSGTPKTKTQVLARAEIPFETGDPLPSSFR